MFNQNDNKNPIPPRSQHIGFQNIALGVGFLVLLQTILLVLLIFQQQAKSLEAQSTPPDCIRQFGYNPKIPQSDGIDCSAAPISIAQKV